MRITHDQLITECNNRGLFLEKITRGYAYIADERSLEKKAAPRGQLLPNRCDDDDLKHYKIYAGWMDGIHNLYSAIKNDRFIAAIKIIRSELGCGLKEAKDICDYNWIEWGKICGRKD